MIHRDALLAWCPRPLLFYRPASTAEPLGSWALFLIQPDAKIALSMADDSEKDVVAAEPGWTREKLTAELKVALET